MPDLTESLLPRLQAHRLAGLDLGEGFIYPHYQGYSILNLPSSLCHLLEAPGFGAGPLAPEILSPLEDRAGPLRRLILVLMDAMSFQRFRRWKADGSAPVWGSLAQEGLLSPLTSIIPSTTTAALTSLWTGRSTAEHGVAGYELWLKEYGVVANMILHTPMSYQSESPANVSLARAGFKPEAFLGLPTLGTHLAAHGITSYAFQHHSIAHSGLSQMFFKDVNVRAFGTAADLWINLRTLIESRPAERQYVWVYWSELDHFSHYYGPDDERPAAEFATFSSAFERFFLSRLGPALRKDTLLILTADHGQVATPKNPHYELRSHPALTRRLHILPTGENRLIYLYLRPGQGEAVGEYLERTWPNQFTPLNPVHAVSAGLFGPGKPHPRLFERLGDLILATRGQAYLWWSEKENPLLGRHGCLSPDEMLVPFLAVRL